MITETSLAELHLDYLLVTSTSLVFKSTRKVSEFQASKSLKTHTSIKREAHPPISHSTTLLRTLLELDIHITQMTSEPPAIRHSKSGMAGQCMDYLGTRSLDRDF
jgi:hypothetical protein